MIWFRERLRDADGRRQRYGSRYGCSGRCAAFGSPGCTRTACRAQLALLDDLPTATSSVSLRGGRTWPVRGVSADTFRRVSVETRSGSARSTCSAQRDEPLREDRCSNLTSGFSNRRSTAARRTSARRRDADPCTTRRRSRPIAIQRRATAAPREHREQEPQEGLSVDATRT